MKPAQWPRKVADFERLPFIHAILRGARNGVEGVGILTEYDWLPDGIAADIWDENWILARARWIKEIAPLLKPDKM